MIRRDPSEPEASARTPEPEARAAQADTARDGVSGVRGNRAIEKAIRTPGSESRGTQGTTPASEKRATQGDTVAAWLDLLCKLLRLPPKEREEIRNELDSHLRDRVRDFMLAGLDADESSRRAIDELGGAAELADRFRAASGDRKRRLLMNATGIGLAAAAVVVSIAALLHQSARADAQAQEARVAAEAAQQAQAREQAARDFLVDALTRTTIASAPQAAAEAISQPMARVAPVAREDAGEVRTLLASALANLANERRAIVDAALAGARQDHSAAEKPTLRSRVYQPPADPAMERLEHVQVELGEGAKYADLFEQLAKSGVLVRADKLAAMGVQSGDKIPLAFGKSSAAAAIRAINEALREGDHTDTLAVRAPSDDSLVLAPESHFDRQERVLATYDIRPILDRRAERTGEAMKVGDSAAEVSQLVMELVHKGQWEDQGGDRASMKVFDSKLFIQAPARFHPQIKWVLEELRADEEGEGQSRAKEQGVPAVVDRATAVRWRDSVPLLAKLPILNNFKQDGSVTDRVGVGPLTIRATDDGKVLVIGPDGELQAREVQIDVPGTSVQAPAKHDMKMCTLTVADAASTAETLNAIVESAPAIGGASTPGLRIVPMVRTNQVAVVADARRLQLLQKLVELIDRPAPEHAAPAIPESRVYKAHTMSAATLRDLLGKVFNTAPLLKECSVVRVMEVNDDRLTLTATADQISVVDRIVAMVDGAGAK